MNAPTTRIVVEKIQSYLGECSQLVICRYLGVSTEMLSQEIEKPFAEILQNKTGRRLDALLFVLECARKDETISPATLHRLLTLPASSERDGWKLDVVSAIHEDLPQSQLWEIFQKAVEELRKSGAPK